MRSFLRELRHGDILWVAQEAFIALALTAVLFWAFVQGICAEMDRRAVYPLTPYLASE
jgi:hypothetical protein